MKVNFEEVVCMEKSNISKNSIYGPSVTFFPVSENWEKEIIDGLEDDIKKFIENDNPDIIDIKYCVSTSMTSEDQIYCFSALIMYK